MPSDPRPASALPTVRRLARYASTYLGRIVIVFVTSILFAIFAFLPISLIKPFADNHLVAETGRVSSRNILLHLEDGTAKPLDEALPTRGSRYPDWVLRNQLLRSILVSGGGGGSKVTLVANASLLPPTTVLVTLPGKGLLGRPSKVTVDQAIPKELGRVHHVSLVESKEQPAPIWLYAVLVPILFFIKGVLGVIRSVVLASVSLNVVRDIQNDLYSKILRQPVAFFRHSRTGDLMSRMVNDVHVLSSQVVGVLQDLIQSPFEVAACIAGSFLIDWKTALLILLLVPALALPMGAMSRRIRKASRRAQEKRADISSVLVETLTGVEVVKAFNMEDYEQRRYQDETRTLLRREMKIRKARAFSSPATEMAAAFGVAGVIVIAMMSQEAAAGSVELGNLATIAAAFTMTIKPLDRFWKAKFQLGEMAEAGKRIFTVMDREPEIVDAPDAVPVPKDWREIRFENVNFAYGGEPVLKDLNVTVKRGEKIAIVGKTGAGKTTLVNLIARFHDVTEGAVRFDDLDVRKVRLDSLLEQIGIVTQRTVLFNDTVARNIAYGRPDIPLEEICHAAEAAYADEFIRELPNGYDTVIGEMGTRLSGGQAQRVAIARAILKNPPILILDEATASLDTASEQLVQRALDSLMEHRTTFAIAHRLSTILNADRILVLEEGRIVESGPHAELYARGGVYTGLYDAQFARGNGAVEGPEPPVN
ncbi:MAG: ABC transporter ATP-binding protein [Candidatus Omnitrophica bacterium]|nr:ABC transporter ATP-binding protein [Candidatus Omnitrophota bacterium]